MCCNLIKLQAWITVFFLLNNENFMNIYFEEYLQTTASKQMVNYSKNEFKKPYHFQN